VSGKRADTTSVPHRESRFSLSLALQREGEGGQRSRACERSGEVRSGVRESVAGWGGFYSVGGATVVLGAVVSANPRARADVTWVMSGVTWYVTQPYFYYVIKPFVLKTCFLTVLEG
jgi:glutamate synthase domain-containing protein 3